MRFQKHGSGGGIRAIEAHHERQKDTYASNPDIDPSRSRHNMHLICPGGSYSQEIETRLQRVQGRRIRKDAVRLVDTLITASPGLFDGWEMEQVRSYFVHALDFIKAEIGETNIVSAVVHMDEATPHMHLCFTPITEDDRLSAKEILGNRKKLVEWQNKFHAHMSIKYPSLERGQAAQVTGRKHEPTQLYKQAVHLDSQLDQINRSVDEIKPTNTPRKKKEIKSEIVSLIPGAETFLTYANTANSTIENLQSENAHLSAKLLQQEDWKMEAFLKGKEVEKYEKLFRSLPPEVRQNLSPKFRQHSKEK